MPAKAGICILRWYTSAIMPGKFIVIEGTDGSGKTLQTGLLVERLKKEGRDVATIEFPRYTNPSCYFIEKYLNGKYGELKDIGPEKASLFYALDRFDASFEMREWIAAGRIVVANRYVASNMGHQGSKIPDGPAREKFFSWIYALEYGTMGIPKPDLNIFLHVPATIAYDLVAKKAERGYLNGAARDMHESDIDHLKQSEGTYEEITKMFPAEFTRVECAPDGAILPPEAVFAKVWEIVSKIV